jgi:hypothetical protein
MAEKLPLNYSATFVSGDDSPFVLTYKPDGTPADLTGYTAVLDILTDFCVAPEKTINAVIAAPATGVMQFPFSGAEKEALIIDCADTCYLMTVTLTEPGGDNIALMKGTARIEKT